jgi:hypothetical protein
VEFNVGTLADNDKHIMYALEDSTCLNRFLCGPCRPFEMNLSEGAEAGGAPIAKYSRPLRCATGPGKCCCYQEMAMFDVSGVPAGSTVETCYCCVPQFNVIKPNGTVEYKLSQPTCCGGMFVNLCAEGFCNCRIPFYIFNADSPTSGKPAGKVVKVWSGFASEAFTTADNFELEFPGDAQNDSKARLIGALFLLNQLFFEKSQAAHQWEGGSYSAIHDE